MLDPSVFRMYDIRGVAGQNLTEELALAVGRSLGTRIRRAGGQDCAIARDVRHSSPGLLAAAAKGLCSCGLKVLDLGQAPTPVLYHALHRLHLGGGIVVTGSHNPKQDNGLKLCLKTACLFGEDVVSLRTQALAEDFVEGEGEIQERPYLQDYLEEICERFCFPAGLKVGVDAGNGVMGPVVLAALKHLGVVAVPLYCEPDGDFPHHIPDPEVPACMARLGEVVRQEGCACGLGFDGDGDRVGILDERGQKICADRVLAVFARDMLTRYPGGLVRYDVKCSDFLDPFIRACGGVPVMGVTGHSLLKRDIRKLDAVLGGELSGHIIFNRGYLPIDDSLFCAFTFLSLLEGRVPASSLFAGFPELVSTPEIKLPCPDAAKFEVVAGLLGRFRKDYKVLDVDGARVSLGENTWFLVRCSNTTPNLTIRLEAPNKQELEHLRALLLAALEEHPEVQSEPLRSAF